MATNSKGRIEITDLDFDTVKSNFKTFLSQQNSFTDYNFEGSGMSVLMDLLAYNTHYLAFHANMLANEMFIDTSLTRAASVSHAKIVRSKQHYDYMGSGRNLTKHCDSSSN